jgi:hypothetical protein
MRAITVRQPWAWQIVNQGKNIENRTRNIAGKYRGPVAIHAGLKADDEAMRWLPARAPEWVTAPRIFYYGAILGVADLVDVHHGAENARIAPCGPHCGEWGEGGSWHLVLANPRLLPRPIYCRGMLGLWTPPADILGQLQAVANV